MPGQPPKLINFLPPHRRIVMRRGRADQDTPTAPVVHDHATVMLFLRGEATFWMQGLYTLGPGSLLIVPASAPHYLHRARDVDAIGISFCVSCVPASARPHLRAALDAVRSGGCASRQLTPAEQQALAAQLVALEAELEQPGPGHHVAVDGHLSLITIAILRAADGALPAAPVSASPLVAQALTFIYRRATAGISLRDVAAHVARSPAHVTTAVRSATGETVVGWITRARMSHGRQLLLHTDDNIDNIAQRCGFASPSHFHRAFKRAHGTPPGAWRRAHQIPRRDHVE